MLCILVGGEFRACYVTFRSHLENGYVWIGREEGCDFRRAFRTLDEVVNFYKKSFVTVSIAYLD